MKLVGKEPLVMRRMLNHIGEYELRSGLRLIGRIVSVDLVSGEPGQPPTLRYGIELENGSVYQTRRATIIPEAVVIP